MFFKREKKLFGACSVLSPILSIGNTTVNYVDMVLMKFISLIEQRMIK